MKFDGWVDGWISIFWWFLLFKMNIKALVYARYSTSIKIHSIIKEDSNRSINSDIEKVSLCWFSSQWKSKLWGQGLIKEINSRLSMGFGLLLTIKMTYLMLSAPVRSIPKGMPLECFKNWKIKLVRSTMWSIRLRKISRLIQRNMQMNSVINIMTWERWTNWL